MSGGHENYYLKGDPAWLKGRWANGFHVECNGDGTLCWAHQDTASPYIGANFSWSSLNWRDAVVHGVVDEVWGHFGVYAFWQ